MAKTMKTNSSFFIIFIFALLFCADSTTKGQSNSKPESYNIKPFEVTILNSDFSMAYSLLAILTNNDLKIVFKAELVGEKDSVLFSKHLPPSETLQQISNINLDTLKERYGNDSSADGSQLFVTFNKNGEKKSVQLSNFYQADIGKLISLSNSLVPDEYKISYDKEKLNF
jgi:hypothetical protein